MRIAVIVILIACSYANAQDTIRVKALRRYAFANFYYQHQSYSEAYNWYQRTIDYGFESSYLYYKMANCLLYTNMEMEAIVLYNKSQSLYDVEKIKEDETHTLYISDVTGENERLWVFYVESLAQKFINNEYEALPYIGFHNNIWNSAYDFTLEKIYKKRCAARFIAKDYTGVIHELRNFHKAQRDSDYYTCYYYGLSLLQLGKFEPSKRYLSYSIIHNKQSNKYLLPEAYYYRGVCHYKLKKKDNACMDFRSAADMGLMESYLYLQTYCNEP